MRATTFIYKLAGYPDVSKSKQPTLNAGTCQLCGEARSELVKENKALGSGFANFDEMLAPGGEGLCVPCVWSFGSRPPDTMRMWSVVARTDREMGNGNDKAKDYGPHIHCTAGKQDARVIIETLADPPAGPWCAWVADSGQKHIAPFVVLNKGAGPWCVRFETVDVYSDPGTFAHVCYHVACLFVAGFHRDDIASGQPRVSALRHNGITVWKKHAECLRTFFGGSLIEMCAFMMGKDHGEWTRDFTAGRSAAHGHCGRDGAGDDALSIDRHDRPEAVVGASEDGAGDQCGRRRQLPADVREDDGQAPDSERSQGDEQMDLFACDDVS